MFGSLFILLGQQFFTDDKAYNFYNTYARNRDFSVRRKGIREDKSRRTPHEVICRKFCCNKEGVD